MKRGGKGIPPRMAMILLVVISMLILAISALDEPYTRTSFGYEPAATAVEGR